MNPYQCLKLQLWTLWCLPGQTTRCKTPICYMVFSATCFWSLGFCLYIILILSLKIVILFMIVGTCNLKKMIWLLSFVCNIMPFAVPKVNNSCSSTESTPKVRPVGESNNQVNKSLPLRGKTLMISLYNFKLISFCSFM